MTTKPRKIREVYSGWTRPCWEGHYWNDYWPDVSLVLERGKIFKTQRLVKKGCVCGDESCKPVSVEVEIRVKGRGR